MEVFRPSSRCFILDQHGWKATKSAQRAMNAHCNSAAALTLTDKFFINIPLYCLSPSSLPSPHPFCLGYSSAHRVRDVTGGCLFNESSLEGVMKSSLTPLTTRLISSRDTRHHAAVFCSLARGCHRPKGQIKDSLKAPDTYPEILKTDRKSLFWSNSYHFSRSYSRNDVIGGGEAW